MEVGIRKLHLPLHSLEAVRKLLEEVLNDTLVVVTPTQDVIESGKTVGLAGFFLMVKLLCVELMVTDYTPVVARGIHRETGSERSVNTDDH